MKRLLQNQYFRAGLILFAILCGIFGSVIFGQKTLLPTDHFNMAYLPMADHYKEFDPYNHFEDDILRFYFDYKAQAQKYLYKPYWNPYSFGGIPQYAVTYATHFSSTNWLFKLGSVERMYNLKLILQLFIAGMGMFFLLTRLNLRFATKIFFATAYMLNSMFITLMLREWMTGPYSWFPWYLTYLLAFFSKRTLWNFSWTSLLLALCFTDGFFQSSGAILFTSFILVIWHCYSQKKWNFKVWGSVMGILIFALALSSIMWFPQIEYFIFDLAKGSSRVAGNDYGKSLLQRLLALPFLVGFAMPELLGTVRTLDFTKLLNSNLQDFQGYIGVVPLLFTLGGIFSFKKLPKEASYFLLLIVVGIAIPILTPLDKFLYFRYFITYIVGACVIGALFLDKWLKAEISVRTFFSKILKNAAGFYSLALMSFATLNIYLFFYQESLSALLKNKIMTMPLGTTGTHHPEWMLKRIDKMLDFYTLSNFGNIWKPFVIFGLFLIFFFLFKRKKIKDAIFAISILLLTVLDLGWSNYQWLPRNDLNSHPLFQENAVTSFLKKVPQYRSSTTLNMPANYPMILPPNVAAPFKFYSLDGFDGMRPSVAMDLVQDWENFQNLGLLNVKYIVRPVTLPEKSLKKVFDQNGVLIYENPWAKTRGLVLSDLEMSHTKGQSVSIEMLSENAITYKINSPSKGYLVTSETYYPGWKASVNGKTVDIAKTKNVLRAVRVDEQSSSVHFEFQPTSYKYGLIVTFCAFIALISLLIFSKRSITSF